MDEVMKAFGGSKDERSSLSKMKTKAEDFSREEAAKHSLETSFVTTSKVTDDNRRTISARRISPAEYPSPYQNGETALSVPQRNAVDKQQNTQHEVWIKILQKQLCVILM